MFNVLKKVPRVDGRVDLNSPVFSVVVTVTCLEVAVDIEPDVVVVEGGVTVVGLPLLEDTWSALEDTFDDAFEAFDEEMAPMELTIKLGL